MLFLQFLREGEEDMMGRGVILETIVVEAVALWNTLGTRLAARLDTVVGAVR